MRIPGVFLFMLILPRRLLGRPKSHESDFVKKKSYGALIAIINSVDKNVIISSMVRL